MLISYPHYIFLRPFSNPKPILIKICTVDLGAFIFSIPQKCKSLRNMDPEQAKDKLQKHGQSYTDTLFRKTLAS